MKTHELKTWPGPFEAILDGSKPYEIRRADRQFAVGDTLLLREWDPTTSCYSGRQVERRVTYLTPGGAWGLPSAICVMGLAEVQRCSECKAPCDPDGYCDPCAKAAEAKWRAEHGGKSQVEMFVLRKTARAEAQEALNRAAADAWIKRDEDSMILLGRALQAHALSGDPSPSVRALAAMRSPEGQ